MSQWRCPICGTPASARVYRKPLQGKITLPPDEDMTVVTYCCQNGHVCFASPQSSYDDWRNEEAA